MICAQCGRKSDILAQDLCISCAPDSHGKAQPARSSKADLVPILRISDDPVAKRGR